MEIAGFVKPDFIANTVPNLSGEIAGVFTGNWVSAWTEATKLVDEIFGVEIEEEADIVIATAGGYPKDINLYQAQKAISHASVITKDGGVVILVAECAEGIGSTSFEQFMTGITKTEEVMLKFRETGFQIGPHKAFMIAKQAARVRIYLISELSAEQTRKFLINPSVNLQTAFSEAINLLPKNPKIAIMPHATNTIPYLVRDTA